MKMTACMLFAIALACTLSAGTLQHRSHRARHKALPKLKPAPLTAPAKALVGTWLLNGTDKNTRFVLAKDGVFRAVGSGYSSTGKWSLDPAGLKLVWTVSDGKKLAPGAVKAVVPLDDPKSFHIEKFTYRLVK